jgi:predicted metalloprotease with PDZ domain
MYGSRPRNWLLWTSAIFFITAVFVAWPMTSRAVATERKTGEIQKKGNVALVSKKFADEVKKNNDIILTQMALKSRFSKEGRLNGIQLVQIDRGGAVEKAGFMARDTIVAINGIEPHEWEPRRASIEQSTKFDVTILRQGKQRILKIEIR